MSFKTILIPMEQHDAMASTLATALLLARKFNAYIEGFALQPAMLDLYAADITGSMPVAEVKESNAKFAAEARVQFDAFMTSNGIAKRVSGADVVSYGWLDDAVEGENFVGSYGRVFDVTVVGRPGTSMYSPRMATLETCLFDSGRPVLIAPPKPVERMGENILVAWNGSTEQAHTNALAMPILRRATKVTVLSVEGGIVPGPTGEQMARCLEYNGIKCDAITVKPTNQTTGEAIMANAAALGCDLIVKGAYTQSRLRQMIFGGATRHLLTKSTLPILMAH
jgi:hypothetical protein